MTIEKDVTILLKNLENINKEILKDIQSIDYKKLLRQTHNKEQNPNKENWAPRKHNYSHPILKDTKKLYKSYKQYNKAEDITVITNTASYAKYHQSGTKHLAKRLILPTTLPEHWLKLINKKIKVTIKKYG